MALAAYLRTITSAGLDLLFPPQCAGCGMPGEEFCARCAQQVKPVPETICLHCGRPQRSAIAYCRQCRNEPSSLALARAAALHTAPLREAIHALKYGDRPQLAQPLGRYLIAAFQREPWLSLSTRIDAVVPAPLHADRLEERGYNQSELLSAVLCDSVGFPLKPDWLRRVRATRQQVGLNPAERMQNVAGAFQASHEVTNQTLLVVDDVYTTGATLQACAAAAHAGGAREVFALALAIPAHTW